MSGIAGILNLDGRPVEVADLVKMTDVIAHRGPDGTGHWVNGHVGLAHRMFRTTPESFHEEQPLIDDAVDLCLALDGRVDNRPELRAELESAGARLRDNTDAELVLRTYATWGTAGIVKVIGDFAFAIWDGRRREFICARDYLGKRPFYYYHGSRHFRFGSEPQQVLLDPRIGREPNEGMVAEYLAWAITSTSETLFNDLLRLPPGHWLSVSDQGLKVRRYWDWSAIAPTQDADDRQLSEHFRELFATSVTACLRSTRQVGAELSGGIDSSSVVSMAQHLLDGDESSPRLETYSMTFPGRPCDESLYIEEVVRHWKLGSNLVSPRALGDDYFEGEIRRTHDFPGCPNGVMKAQLFDLAVANGVQVLLTGEGGDDWFAGTQYHYADLLRRLRLPTLTRELFADRARWGGSASGYLLHYGIKPLLPHTARRLGGRLLRPAFQPELLDRSFCRRVHLMDRVRQEQPTASPTFGSGALIVARTTGGAVQLSESAERFAALHGIELRDPFEDRRLVSFAVGMTENERGRRSGGKFLIRLAMDRLVPPLINNRRDKAEFTHAFCEEMRAIHGETVVSAMRVEENGWVRGDRVREVYRRTTGLYDARSPEYRRYCWRLWAVLGVEKWARSG